MFKRILLILSLYLLFLPVFVLAEDSLNINLDAGPCCYWSVGGRSCQTLPVNFQTCRQYSENQSIDPTYVQSVACDSFPECPNYVDKTPTNYLKPIKIKLNIPIPGLEELSQEGGAPVTSETLPKYIGGVYKFLIGIAGILAVMVIAYGGIVWLFSGGASEKISHAKELIVGAVAGLLLALGSYLLLYTINPKLVNFTNFTVPSIKVVEYIKEAGQCDSDKEVNTISGISKVVIEGASDPRLTSDTINKLRVAAAQVQGTLVITSAYRNYETQARLYNCYKTKIDTGECPSGCGSCNKAAEPKCSAPHQTGKAVDVCSRGGPQGVNTCSYIREACNDGNCLTGNDKLKLDIEQQYLQGIMINAGFSHFCGEWWHFENSAMSVSCPAGEHRQGAGGGD